MLTRLRADKFLYAGIIYAGRVDNSATETNRLISKFSIQKYPANYLLAII